MVDRSLETLAADRGITICFADLDEIEGLWLPEERTILVSNRLGERRAAEVLDHELSHVAIEDGHADLDAGVRRRVIQARITVSAVAVACLLLLVGIRLELAGRSGGDLRPTPPPQAGLSTAPPQTGQVGPAVPVAATSPPVVTQVFPRPTASVRTVTVSATVPSSPAASSAPASVSPVVPSGPAKSVATTTPAPSSAPPSTSSPPPSTTPPPTSSSPSPTAPAGTSAQLADTSVSPSSAS